MNFMRAIENKNTELLAVIVKNKDSSNENAKGITKQMNNSKYSR